MGTIIKNTTSAFVDGQQITSDALNNLIDDAILNTTAVSAGTGLTVNASTGVLSMDTSLTGKTLTGGSLNNCPIGASTPNTGAFTTLSASGGLTGNVTGNVTGGTGSFTTLTASDDANFDSGTLFVDASADSVGIGTVSPSCKLDVNSGATDKVALFESTDTTAYIELADNTGSVQFITPSSGALRIATGGSGAGSVGTSGLFIDQSQNVGISDDTPSYKLDVNGTGRFVNDLTLDEELIHNLSGAGALPGYSAGTFGAVLEDGGANGSSLYMSRKNSWALYLTTDTTLNAQSDKVVQFADLNGQSGDQDNVVGSITITSSSTAYNTSSDYRLKENTVDIADGISRLKQLKPYRFNFTRDPSTTVDGFFAHEVSSVVPESISGEKDQVDDEGNPVYQGIDQSKLVPLLTAALQEAVAKIEALEARVQTLEG